MRRKLQILNITSIKVKSNLFNVTAINRERKDPYWVEFLETYFNSIDVDVEIKPFDKIDKSKKWIINLDLQMWEWEKHDNNILEFFNVDILKELQTGNAYMILNHQCEAFTIDFFNLFYSKFKKIKDVPYNKIIYMVAAADVESIYEKYVTDFKIEKNQRITVMYVHHVYKRFNYDGGLDFFKYDNTYEKEKKFISLNRRFRDHRLMLVSALAEHNLLSHGFVSLGLMPDEVTTAYNELKKHFISVPDSIGIMSGFSKIKNILPLQIDKVDLRINQFQITSLSSAFYQKSCFSVVSSTHALSSQEQSVNFTEKEIKPILARHPFIIYNRPNVLKHLKNMGFLSFEPWFDERYDREDNDLTRLEMIIKEVDRLCKLSFKEWKNMLDEMKPIVDHNYNRLVNHNYDHCFFNSDLKKMLYYVS